MKKRTGLFLIVLALTLILLNLYSKKTPPKEVFTEDPIEPKYEYGILVDTFNVQKGVVQNEQTLGEILYSYRIDHPKIAEIVKKSKGIFDVRRVQTGQSYTVFCSQDSLQKATYFIYEEKYSVKISLDS